MDIVNIPVDTRTLAQIHAAASKEHGSLVVAAGGDAQAQYDFIRSAFNKSFPDIGLDLTVNFSKYHDSLIDRAFYANTSYCDVTFLQDVQDFPRWKKEKRLLYYKPPTFDNIYNQDKDLDGAYFGAFLFSFGSFLYDNTKVSEADLPRNYLDVLDPKWKGKMVLTYPNDDDAVGYLFSIIISRYGFGWFDALAKQDVQWVRGTATPAYIIAENHNPATAPKRPPHFADNNQNKRVLSFTTAGYPMPNANVSFKDVEPPEQHMSWAQTGAIFKTTTRPEKSKLFMAWITSEEFQKSIAQTGPTVMKNLDEASGFRVAESKVTQTTGFPLYQNDRDTAGWWRFQYETTLGTPQGRSPLDVYNFDDVRNL